MNCTGLMLRMESELAMVYFEQYLILEAYYVIAYAHDCICTKLLFGQDNSIIYFSEAIQIIYCKPDRFSLCSA